MMVSVLTELGHDHRDEAEGILASLLPSEKISKLQSLRQLLGKATVTTDVRSRNAKKIAIEVASNLNIPQILHTAALQADPTIRTAAVRYTYHLWQREPNAGFEVLEHLAEHAVSSLIPKFAVFESVFGLSLVIFFDHPRDEEILNRLQSIWRTIIAKILDIKESENNWRNLFRTFIRERIFSFIITVFFKLVDEMPRHNFDYSSLEPFFRLGIAEKMLYRNLIQYIDVEGDYSKAQMENDFLKASRVRNKLIESVTLMGLVAHAFQAPTIFLPFLEKLFAEAQNDPLPTTYLEYITNILWDLLRNNPMMDNVFDFFVHATEECQEYYVKNPQTSTDNFYGAEAFFLGPYIFVRYKRGESIHTPWLETRINTALLQNNIPFFDFLLKSELPLLGIKLQQPQIALDTLALFFNNRNEEIDQMIESFLAHLRIYYSDEVDNFLEEQQVPEKFRLQVLTNEPPETIGELIEDRTWYFIIDDIILDSPTLRVPMLHILHMAADCKNLREWLDYVLREIINLVYGGVALRQKN
jgi:hypothetical protein